MENQEELMETDIDECEGKEGEFIKEGRIEDIDRTMKNPEALKENGIDECEDMLNGQWLQPRNKLIAALVLTSIAFHPFLMKEYKRLTRKWLKEVVESCLKRVKLPAIKYIDVEEVSKLIIPSLDMVQEIEKDSANKVPEPHLGHREKKKIALEKFRKFFSKVVIPIFINEKRLTEKEVECVEFFWEYQEKKTKNPNKTPS
ncbi:hypothetical protein JTE90_004451 [Oedothorax gibbosus]|uniref:Uncharacterized protein n=1 Tax=Oedothorax gibbosus TaxID=931172 RepID=A0AAV6URW4_9ARAC|nr:hypothetical protein JTE90_004451 [Oedothorax gibbosus]